jgi:hypothetical protein
VSQAEDAIWNKIGVDWGCGSRGKALSSNPRTYTPKNNLLTTD